jgi:hypothetical protein
MINHAGHLHHIVYSYIYTAISQNVAIKIGPDFGLDELHDMF